MDIKTLKLEALPVLQEAGVTALIIGEKGVGKSAAVKQYADSLGIGFVDLRLGQMTDAGDLYGLPEISDGKTFFRKPNFFPTSGKGIIFLDEVNRAPKDLMQAIFQLVYDRRIGDYVLPKGWFVVAAMNPATDDYDVLDFTDVAFADRFCQLRLTPNFKDYIEYLRGRETDPSLVDFLNTNAQMLKKSSSEDFKMKISSSERSWDRVGDVLKAANKLKTTRGALFEIIGGMVGAEAAQAYMNHKDNFRMDVEASEILEDYAKVRAKIKAITSAETLRADVINRLNESLVEHLNAHDTLDKENDHITQYIKDCPPDITEAFAKMVVESLQKKQKGDKEMSFANYQPFIKHLSEIRKGVK